MQSMPDTTVKMTSGSQRDVLINIRKTLEILMLMKKNTVHIFYVSICI